MEDKSMEEERVEGKNRDSALEQALEEAAIRRRKKKMRRNLLAALLILCVAAGAAFWYANRQNDNRLAKESEAIAGLIPGKSDSEIQEILDQVVEKGMVNVSINQTPVFYGKKGEIGIQNIPANHYSYTVTITLDGTGEELYKSELIDPGYYVNEITLEKRLTKGTHPATAVFRVYDVQEESDAEIATLSSSIVLSVLS